jgi:hypothetical protein
LTALQSTEGGDCADAELANTKSDIARIRMVVLDPSRDQDWARFLGQYAVGHPNPLLSVIVCHSSQLESSIAAWGERRPRALFVCAAECGPIATSAGVSLDRRVAAAA